MKNQTLKNSTDKISICLNMIVKNESKVILRCLESVYPILDYYCINDTGSTDGTQELIRNFFKEKGIPGKVVENKWENYCTARNQAIESAKELTTELNLNFPWGFWIDADEQLVINPNLNINSIKTSLLNFDGSNCIVHYGSSEYFRMQFFSLTSNWIWYGPIHEVLVPKDRHEENSKAPRIASLDGLYTLVTADGNSWTSETQQQKYEGHAKIILDYVNNDVNKDPRWLFYLAQSYRDAVTPENHKKSIEWYQKRVEAQGGYWEEIYFSQLMIATLKASLKYPIHEVIDEYLKCGKYNKFRIEHILPISLYYQGIKEYDIAYVYSSYAMKFAGKNPNPNSSLFIDPLLYSYKIYDLHSINSYYSGKLDDAKTTFKLLWKQVEKCKVPQQEIEHLQKNKKFFLDIK